MDELSDSLILLLEQVHRLVDMCYFAASRTLSIAERYHLEMPGESQKTLSEEEWQLRESIERFSAFLEGVPFRPFPFKPGQASSGSGEIRRT